MEQAKYSVRGYCSDTDGGYDDESEAETLAEAKKRAKYMMTEEHTRIVESTVPVIYVEVINNKTGEVVLDFGSLPYPEPEPNIDIDDDGYEPDGCYECGSHQHRSIDHRE